MTTDKKNEAYILLLICFVQFITPFMASSVNIALPAIGKTLHATTFQLSLAPTLYILGLSILILPAGQLADLFGRKKTFIAGICAFTITTIMLALSSSIWFFLVSRFFQGMATSLIVTSSLAILSSVIPPQRRGRSMGIVISFVYGGLSAGPALGGILVTQFGWGSIFWFTALFSLIAIIMSLTKINGEWWGNRNQKFDYLGSVLFALSLGLLVLGITGKEWVGDRITMLLILSGILTIVFLVTEYKTKNPIFGIKIVLGNFLLSKTLIASFCNYAAFFGVIFFFSLYFQSVKDFTPQTAGMLIMLQTIIQCILSPYVGRLTDRMNPGMLASAGMFLCTIALSLAIAVDQSSSTTFIIIIFIIFGCGFGLFSSPNTTIILNSVEKEFYGMASSMSAVSRNLGMLASMAISTILIEKFMGHETVTKISDIEFVTTMQAAMTILAILTAFGTICSLGKIRKKI